VDTNQDTSALAAVADDSVGPDTAALRSAGFRLLLEGGSPVAQSVWAEEAGVDRGAFERALREASDRGRVTLDDDGRLVGIAGLTIEPTTHRLDIDGISRWTWCALDAIGILGALEADGSIHSSDPGTGEDIEIVFHGGVPVGDAAMFILAGYADVNVRESWCPQVNFFTSESTATEWVRTQGLEGDVVSIAQVALEAAEMWKPVIDGETPDD